ARRAPSRRRPGPHGRGRPPRPRRAGGGVRHRPPEVPLGGARPRGDRAHARAGGAGVERRDPDLPLPHLEACPEGGMNRARELPVPLARALKAAVELGTVTAAFVLAYLLRFDFAPGPADAVRLWHSLPIAVAAKAMALWYFGLFGNWWWRYVGI